MYLQAISGVFDSQFVKIKYDCDGGFERCGREWSLKLKDAKMNAAKNGGRHVCRSCQMRADNPAKRKAVQEKIKQTNVDRYGTSCAMNSDENTRVRTKKMFGSQEAIDARTEKTKQTNLKKYGVEHAAQSPEMKEKARQTNQERYGAAHPMQNAEVAERARQTVRDRHGVENVMQVPEIQRKQATTTLERYGVEYYNQLPEMRDYLRQHCPGWLAKAWANPWAKGVPKTEDQKRKQRETVSFLIILGEWKAGHRHSWKGHYKAEKCRRETSFWRSGFELLYHWYLDHDPNVEWYDYEPFAIDYLKPDGASGKYHPDFVVKYFADDTIWIVEVKADYLHDSEETRSKYQAAMQYTMGFPNMKYRVLLKADIDALGLDFHVVSQHEQVAVTHDPRK